MVICFVGSAAWNPGSWREATAGREEEQSDSDATQSYRQEPIINTLKLLNFRSLLMKSDRSKHLQIGDSHKIVVCGCIAENHVIL